MAAMTMTDDMTILDECFYLSINDGVEEIGCLLHTEVDDAPSV
jgi:hypothetical protein